MDKHDLTPTQATIEAHTKIISGCASQLYALSEQVSRAWSKAFSELSDSALRQRPDEQSRDEVKNG